MDNNKLFAWLILLFVAALSLIAKVKNYLKTVVLVLNLPGPAVVPILGNVLLIKDTKSLIHIGNNVSQFYAPLFRVWIFFLPVIVIYEPEHLKIVLNNTKVSEKSFFYKVMHNFIGNGLITSTGENWKKSRKAIQPIFHVGLLESYFQDFLAVSEQMVKENFNRKCCLQITKIVNDSILTILHRTVLGVDLKSEPDTPFRRGELLLIKRILKPWLLFDSVFKRSKMCEIELKQCNDLHAYVKNILSKRQGFRKNCLLNRLMDLAKQNILTEPEVINEAVTFMLAGQDSVGAAVVFSLYHLAKHQNVQEKVYREIVEVINGDCLNIEQLNRLNYLEQCVKETLRLLPSIPLMARVLTADVKLDHHTVPCGSNIFVSPFATHRLPHIFPNPLRFDPDRFSMENIKKIHPYGFLPFSLGPRNCIGYKFAYLEMKTIIATIIKNHHLTVKNPDEDLTLSYRVTLRSKGGIWLNIQPRNKRYVD